MTAKVEIEAGVCGFTTTVTADSADSQNVTFSIESNCEKIQRLNETVQALGPVDAYMEIHPARLGSLIKIVGEGGPGCCVGCIVPIGIFKAMQVAASLSLPRDITMKIEGGA